jgi:hypothetical protein
LMAKMDLGKADQPETPSNALAAKPDGNYDGDEDTNSQKSEHTRGGRRTQAAKASKAATIGDTADMNPT